jgi:hypothetical protein
MMRDVAEKPRDIHTSPDSRLMQRSPPVLVLGCHISAVLDEDARNFHMSIFGNPMQRG